MTVQKLQPDRTFYTITIVGGLLVFAVWSLVMWQAGSQFHSRIATAYGQAITNVDTAREYCRNRPQENDCLAAQLSIAGQTLREEQDLAAQQSMATWALWMALIAALQTIVSLGGVVLLVRNLAMTREANTTSMRAVKISEDALLESHNTAAKELRPYVAVDVIDGGRIIDRTSSIVVALAITIVWKNCGQTPARRVRNSINYAVFKGAIPANFDFPNPVGHPENVSLIGPGQPFRANINIQMHDLQKAFARTHTLYYWGWVEYSDSVKGTRFRTETCSQIEIFENPLMPNNHFEIVLHRTYNGMDDDCVHPIQTHI